MGGVAIFIRDDSNFVFLDVLQVIVAGISEEMVFEVAEVRPLINNSVVFCSLIYKPPNDENLDFV